MTLSRKALRIGTSVGTTLPKEFLQACGIRPGSALSLTYDARRKGIIITCPKTVKKDTRNEIANAALRFIKKYKADLKSLKNK